MALSIPQLIMSVILALWSDSPNQKTSTNSSIYLTRGGFIDMTDGSLRRAAIYGLSWSRTVFQSLPYAYVIALNTSNIVPSDNYFRWLGSTVQPNH